LEDAKRGLDPCRQAAGHRHVAGQDEQVCRRPVV
jgi:hypothetical protein